jgi:hypothetical protein
MASRLALGAKNVNCGIPTVSSLIMPLGRVSDMYFASLHAMLGPPAEKERERIIPGLCPRGHTDQVMKGGTTKVHI